MSRKPTPDHDESPARGLTRAELLRGPAPAAAPARPRASWRSLAEKRGGESPRADEFAEELPAGPLRELSRRDFLRVGGAGLAAGGALACNSRTARKALPLLSAAPEQTPGVDAWYATVCGGCAAGCGALARARDGRPLKLEGNPDHPVSRGGLCAAGQAQLRALYDSARPRSPEIAGGSASWAALDGELAEKFAALAASGGAVRVLSPTPASPALRRAVDAFLARFQDGHLVVFDALSAAAIPAAHETLYGARLFPRYQLANADVLVAVECDFLGGWIDPVGFAKAWSSRRDPGGERPMSRHWQFEAGFSVTGGAADERVRIAPSQAARVAGALAGALARRAGLAAADAPAAPAELAPFIAKAAGELWAARGAALVMCGSNDAAAQHWTALANRALEAEGRTLDLAAPDRRRQGDDRALDALVAEMAAGSVGAVVLLNANPLYELPASLGFAEAFKKVPLRVGLSLTKDESASACTHLAPDCHFLEAWRDAEPVAGIVGLGQPLIRPLFGARDAAASLRAWAGDAVDPLQRLQADWARDYFPKQKAHATFTAFWNAALDAGFVAYDPGAAAPAWKGAAAPAARPDGEGRFELLLIPGHAADGRHGRNPLLNELPDPVTRLTWENAALLAPAAARELGVANGDRLTVEAGGAKLALPAFVQPGLHPRTVAIATGWGRDAGGDTRGANAFALRVLADGLVAGDGLPATVSRAGGTAPLAATQSHFSLAGREEIAPVATLAAFRAEPEKFRPEEPPQSEIVYAPHEHPEHRWAMVVDLARCTGCSACVAGCNVENNIPEVGPAEVARGREMHWLRIDRYYEGDEDDPRTVSQPMMCQQCDNAPCENVCPVIATAHSAEGLNQQVYNRCVGTRYCANNCPYKTRRFNWLAYERGGEAERLALNPDVTVRSRGVMEKCTFCVQRIQDAKAEAKNAGRPLADGIVRAACEQSCPADAMVFGDLKDPASKVSRRMADPRRYAVLGELGVKPAVGYLLKIRNADETPAAPEGHAP